MRKKKYRYPEYPKLRKNRLIKLQQTKCSCEVCGNPAKFIHHIDEDKGNHDISNLAVLCRNCHWVIHSEEGKDICHTNKSKYSEIYGINMSEIAKDCGLSVYEIKKLHNTGTLKDFLEKNKKSV